MIKQIFDSYDLERALTTGIVCLVCPTDSGETRNLVVTRNVEIVAKIGEGAKFEIDHGKDIRVEIDAFDLLKREQMVIQPHLFDGVVNQIASVERYDGPIRNASVSFQRDQVVKVLEGEAELTGTIVFVNESSITQRYVVLLDRGDKTESVIFDEGFVSEDGGKRFKTPDVEGVDFWRHADGCDYKPVINLNQDGYNAAFPFVFVVGLDEDSKTIAVNADGVDDKGVQVFEKVKLNMLPVECEQYLLINDKDVLSVSVDVLEKLNLADGALGLPVLVYVQGLDIIHITLLANG